VGNSNTPFPMPVTMRDEVNIKLGDREMAMLDNNARFIVRALIAEAYAKGFADGRLDAFMAEQIDRQARTDTEK